MCETESLGLASICTSGVATTVHRLHVTPPPQASNLFSIIWQLSTEPRDTCAQFGIDSEATHMLLACQKEFASCRVMYMALLADKPSTIQTCTRGHRFQFLPDVFRISASV